MKQLKISILLAIMFVASFAHADSKVRGHMKPFEIEMLRVFVPLRCGATVVEWRGNDRLDVQQLNRLCTFVDDRFFSFAEGRGYDILKPRGTFSYAVSFIPWNGDYRNLNDNRYRFIEREMTYKVDGYNDHVLHHLFARSDVKYREFELTFIHELVHAYSDYYGVIRQEGRMNDTNEEFATDFTFKYLGVR